jgi:hypothetical protein
VKVIGLNGKTYSWSFAGRSHSGPGGPKRSGLHARVRDFLRTIYPVDRIMEEVGLPGSNGLRIDFYLPLRQLAVEAHGEQHYKFIAHFHGTMMGFLLAKERDDKKKKWCEINDIRLIELPFDGGDDQWQKIFQT